MLKAQIESMCMRLTKNYSIGSREKKHLLVYEDGFSV